MKINEIELVGDQDFSIDKVKYYLSLSSPINTLEKFVLYYLEQNDDRVLILVDDDKNIAAYTMFKIWNNGKVWQARNAQTFSPYKGQQLAGKLYRYVKEVLHKSIQSDTEQSQSARQLWINTLPSLGLKPMIFDTKTELVLDPSDHPHIDVYRQYGDSRDFQYTWIIEHRDHYPQQNLLSEHSLAMPVQGLWNRFNNTKG